MNTPPTASTFSCRTCGAQLTYDANAQAMRCAHCEGQAQVARTQTVGQIREIGLEEGMRMAQRGLGIPVTCVECRACGAKVNVTPGHQTARCAFCDSNQVLPQEASGAVIRPESLVPFRVDKKAAGDKFSAWIAGLWFRPSDLKKKAEVQDLSGVYIPFWTFDAAVWSRWEAEAGYHYYETESYTDSEGKSQTRQVQRTRWQYASGERQDQFDDTLVCASKGVPTGLVQRLTSFQTSQLVPYQPDYLAGWLAEVYVVDLNHGWGLAQGIMETQQRQRCSHDVPGDTQRGLSVENAFSRVTFKHVLLPIWVAAYRYQGKSYQFLVNGQTGEIVGKAPYSVWKILFAVIAVVGVIVALVVVFGE